MSTLVCRMVLMSPSEKKKYTHVRNNNKKTNKKKNVKGKFHNLMKYSKTNKKKNLLRIVQV